MPAAGSKGAIRISGSIGLACQVENFYPDPWPWGYTG
jgi:hypothetical protein